VSQELLDCIRKTAQKHPGARELPADRADAVLTAVASIFVASPENHLWWWDSLKQPYRQLPYGDDDIALSEIRRILGDSTLVRLVVTDDNPRPWPIFEGPVDEILRIIEDQWRFEFFLVPASDEPRWIIFDTHHNQLILGGDLPSGGR
jgi:hypothetical protein